GVDQTAGTRHVFHDDRRVPRDIFPQVSADGAGVGIEPAAGGKTDNDPNHLAAVEFLARRRHERCKGQGKPNDDTYGQHESLAHMRPSVLWEMEIIEETMRKQLRTSMSAAAKL